MFKSKLNLVQFEVKNLKFWCTGYQAQKINAKDFNFYYGGKNEIKERMLHFYNNTLFNIISITSKVILK